MYATLATASNQSKPIDDDIRELTHYQRPSWIKSSATAVSIIQIVSLSIAFGWHLAIIRGHQTRFLLFNPDERYNQSLNVCCCFFFEKYPWLYVGWHWPKKLCRGVSRRKGSTNCFCFFTLTFLVLNILSAGGWREFQENKLAEVRGRRLLKMKRQFPSQQKRKATVLGLSVWPPCFYFLKQFLLSLTLSVYSVIVSAEVGPFKHKKGGGYWIEKKKDFQNKLIKTWIRMRLKK